MNAGMLINAQDYKNNKLPLCSQQTPSPAAVDKDLGSNEIVPQPVIENNLSVSEGTRARIAVKSFAVWRGCIKSIVHIY